MSFFRNINPNLLVPVMILFLLLRLKSICNASLRMISGLKLFTKKMFHSPTVPTATTTTSENNPQDDSNTSVPLTASEIIDKAIAKLQLTMIEIEDSPQCLHLLRHLLFYDIYDILIYLGLSAFLGYLWSIGYHCYNQEVQISCWVVLLILFLIAFSLQTLVSIVYLTGLDKKESKLAFITSTIVFTISFLLFWIDCSYVDRPTVEAISIHANALLMQIDGNIEGIPLPTMIPMIYAALSLLLALITLGLVIPAIRFSSLWLTILTGPGASVLVSWRMKALLIADVCMPLFVALLFSTAVCHLPSFFSDHILLISTNNTHHSGIESYVTTCDNVDGAAGSGACNPSSAHSDSGVTSPSISNSTEDSYFQQILFIIQSLAIGLMVTVRLLSMKKYLQCHLDSLVSAVSAQIISPNVSEASIALLQHKVKACTGYLMAASTQYLAIPMFAIACYLLFHISSPVGDELCYTLRQHIISPEASTNYLATTTLMRSLNSSASAIEKAGQPYLTDIFISLAGIQMHGNKEERSIGFEQIYNFSMKFSEIYALPSAAAISLSRSLLCIHSLLWFILYAMALYVWKYHPSYLLAKGITSNM